MGVGQNEQPLPNVRRARLSRCEQARLDAVTQASKVSGDVPKSQGDMAFDVLEEDEARPDFVDDSGNVRPQVSGILVAASLSGQAEGLAWITGRDDMNAAAPRAAVEGSQVAPDRSRCQGLVCHPGHESGRSMGFPLDIAHSSVPGLGDVQAEVETPVSGTEGEASQFEVMNSVGMKSHKAHSLVWSLDWRSDGGSRASEH